MQMHYLPSKYIRVCIIKLPNQMLKVSESSPNPALLFTQTLITLDKAMQPTLTSFSKAPIMNS